MRISLSKWFLILLCSLTYSVQAQDGDDWSDDFSSSDDTYEDSWGEDDPWAGEWDESSAETDFFSDQAPAAPEEPKYEMNFQNACENRSELRNKVKMALKPYRYCNAKTTMITFRRYPQKRQLVIPIYYDLQHVLIFNTEGLDQDIIIRVYNRPENDRKRELLFQVDASEKQSTFELPQEYKQSKIFIEYTIPPSDQESNQGAKVSKGCVIFMMGYLDEALAEIANQAEK